MVRFGEAANPGPTWEWQIGVGNSTGLSKKQDLMAWMPGQTWIMSETHLTKHTYAQFCKGLRAVKSPFVGTVHGAPCAERFSENSGEYSGVMLLNRGPARAMVHAFDLDSYATGRMQVAGFMAGHVWIQAGMVYGYPSSKKHVEPAQQTDQILEQVIDRIALHTHGPRLIAGDFNHSVANLPQLRRLREMGFREAQEYAAYAWGQEEKPTGRGQVKLDQLWLSPELLRCLKRVTVRDDRWPDHSTVEAVLEITSDLLQADTWHRPKELAWPQEWQVDVQWDKGIDSTIQYAQFWKAHEQAAVEHQQRQGTWSKAQLGRGQTLATKRVQIPLAPIKKGRPDTVQPNFMGVAHRHNQWFKQLRRFQSMVKCLHPNSGVISAASQQQAQTTWTKCLAAVGFDAGFSQWWIAQRLEPRFKESLPAECPQPEMIQMMYNRFKDEVRKFEQALNRHRLTQAKNKRKHSMAFVFEDCKGPASQQVDTLCKRQEQEVQETCEEEVAIVLEEPSRFDPTKPLVINGKPRTIIIQEHDKVWVDSIDQVATGDLACQETIHASDQEIIEQFRAVWEPRWNKLSHVQPGQWTQINSFVSQVMQPIQWDFPEWAGSHVAEVVKYKKNKAGVGSIEQGQDWPRQLTIGFVTSLAKVEQAMGPDHFRPVTVCLLLGLPTVVIIGGRGKPCLVLKPISLVVCKEGVHHDRHDRFGIVCCSASSTRIFTMNRCWGWSWIYARPSTHCHGYPCGIA